jgi:3'(2'), 5'-bisphosphate nucleotidase
MNKNYLKLTGTPDKSPVTKADIQSSDYITSELQKFFPDIPIISEEHTDKANLNIIKKNKLYWLIDPLDGTWAFIKKRGAFTVNIALIDDGKPIFGLLYSPLHNTCYYSSGKTVVRISELEKSIIHPFRDTNKRVFDFLVSRKILIPELTAFINQFDVCTITQASAAYKFCMMVDNKGDIYPRLKATCLWDVAAGHALLNALGGEIYDLEGSILTYNHDSLINPHFVAYRCHEFYKSPLQF